MVNTAETVGYPALDDLTDEELDQLVAGQNFMTLYLGDLEGARRATPELNYHQNQTLTADIYPGNTTLPEASLREARQRLVLANVGLVFKAAKRVLRGRLLTDELLQVGNLALARAAHRFDSRKGFAFSSYAMKVISTQMWEYLNFQSGGHMTDLEVSNIRKIWRYEKKYSEENRGESPTEYQIATEFDLEVSEVRLLQAMYEFILSLDTETKDQYGSSSSLHERIEVEDPNLERVINLDQFQLRDWLSQLLEDPLLIDILVFGFERSLSHQDIADQRLLVNPRTKKIVDDIQIIKKIEARALEVLRQKVAGSSPGRLIDFLAAQ